MSSGVAHALVVTALAATIGCGRVGFEDRAQADEVDAGGVPSDGDATVQPLTSPNYAFVTSTVTEIGSIGGLAGADGICQGRADAARLPGTYVAWLSSSTANARDRLGTARGWVRPDGRPVADTVDDLVAGAMYYLPQLDEYGDPVTFSEVVTGTLMNGTVASQTCSDWTSTAPYGSVGRPDAGMPQWTDGLVAVPCTRSLPLYCFGVDRVAPVHPAPVTTRRAFVTSSNWTSGGGLASADAECQTEADASTATAGGTYLALLGTDTASPISRFDTSGLPWQRVDGVLLVERAIDLASSNLAAPFDVTATGAHASSYVLTSAGVPDQVGVQTCKNWQSTNQSDVWQCGASTIVGPEFYNDPQYSGGDCSTGGRLYCLEQ
jgi:hypothetical protein